MNLQLKKNATNYIPHYEDLFTINDKTFSIGDKMDRKLTTLCTIHDEICELGATINKMFSFQMLILMAYGFMAITAQFYFLYCGLMGQVITFLIIYFCVAIAYFFNKSCRLTTGYSTAISVGWQSSVFADIYHIHVLKVCLCYMD